MAFTTWAAELARFENALASMGNKQFLKQGYTTSQGQQVVYRKMSELTAYHDWLRKKANEEARGGRRQGPIYSGYGGIS